MRLDWRNQSITVKGKQILLNRYEFLLFTYLMRHPGWIFSKEELYEAIWKQPGEFCGSAVANVVSQIRRKLRMAGAKQDYIQTVVNSGYRFLKEN
ncbi:winged helix-turn-helix domain-containing protein [Enterocloster alcoholdehydrogenati]|uniref:OmpR/PhoB-type domain-containing protein n=1 Tax=Enterocloster alcoholdehydrogenati TaxID=2547410 RepID=A0ABQ0AZA4_9FIRM